MRVVLLVVTVMAVEAAVLYVLISQSSAAPPPGSGSAVTGEGVAAPSALSGDVVEVSVGQFQTTNSIAARGSTVHVTFELTATVSRGQAEAFGGAVKDAHKARIRQAVVQVARSSTMEDLKDPELSVVKRQIKEEINKVLRKSYVNEVIISDYRTMEQ